MYVCICRRAAGLNIALLRSHGLFAYMGVLLSSSLNVQLACRGFVI